MRKDSSHAQGPWAETGIVLNQEKDDTAGKKVEDKPQTEEVEDSTRRHQDGFISSCLAAKPSVNL